MATQKDIEELYDWIHPFHELHLGKCADLSCALFEGDFRKTLEQAQADKHRWALEQLQFHPGDRILDVGCGWGPMIKAVHSVGGQAIGLTLSRAQTHSCRRNNLEVYLLDWNDAEAQKLGMFHGIVSIGAFEHFCSPEQYSSGKQESIYRNFFNFCASILPAGGRLYLQTMVWGKEIPDPQHLLLRAPKDSTELILARMGKFYPGSWLPKNKNQIIKTADKKFRLLNSSNGRTDYIETLSRWGTSLKSFLVSRKCFLAYREMIKLTPRLLLDPSFRIQLASIYHNDQQVCFQREIMDHERLVFQKI